MQNKFTRVIQGLFISSSKRAPFEQAMGEKFSSSASPFCEKGAYHLNRGEERKAGKAFKTALSRVDAELVSCKIESRNVLLQVKGEALLGIWKSRTPAAAESQYDIDQRALPSLNSAIEIFSDLGNLQQKADALELRSKTEGGVRAMDDLYEACKCISGDKESIKRMASAYMQTCEIWGDEHYYKKALEILAMLLPGSAWAAEKTSEVQSKLGDVLASQKTRQPSEPSPADVNSILSKVNGMIASGQLDLGDPRLAEEGVSVMVDGLAEPVMVRKEIPMNFRNIPLSNVPGWLKDEAFEARLGGVMPLERATLADISKLPERKETFARLLTQGMDLKQGIDLCTEGDLLVATDKAAAREKYLKAIAVLGQIPKDSWKAKEAHDLISSLTEKIGQCGGKV